MVQELELDALVKAGIFRSKSEVVDEALRLLFATRPQLRTEAAIQLLKDGQVTLARAAEIAGVTRWEFEEILADHGIQREVTCEPAEELERQVERLSGKPTPPASAPGQVSGRRKE
jgi:predicted HTH domain antitoxin